MKLKITDNLIVTDWIPGILKPEHAGHYQRDRRTPTPRPIENFPPEDCERFLIFYPPPNNVAPAVGKVIELEYWDGRTWWLSTDFGIRSIQSYEGPGSEKHYWRGIEFDAKIHSQRSETFIIDFG